MPCRYESRNGRPCPEKPALGQEFCLFHNPDWASKNGHEMLARIAASISDAEEDSTINCDGWIFPAVSFDSLEFPCSVSFSGASFYGKEASFRATKFDGERTDFSGAEFYAEFTEFFGAQFLATRLDFAEATFLGRTTSFRQARFGGQTTSFARAAFASPETLFQGAEFPSPDTSFFGAAFQGEESDFESVNFQGPTINFSGVEFKGRARFVNANLSGADFTLARFHAAPAMTRADLREADLRSVSGLVLDDSFIRGARFHALAPDPWSVLRRKYTGVMFTFHVLLLLLFLAPYGARAAFLVGQNRAQTAAVGMAGKVADQVEVASGALQVRGEVGALAESVALGIGEIGPCLALECREYPVYQVLLGWDRGVGWSLLVAVMLFYNLLRGVLTYHVSLMREAEERSGYSPPWSSGVTTGWLTSTEGSFQWTYHWLYRAHQIMAYLVVVAILSFVWHLVDWLSRPVWLPL